jgi:alpha/beta superfamily hydrolase
VREDVQADATPRIDGAAGIMASMSELLSSAPDQFPGQASSFALPGPAGKLELVTDVADRASARAGVAVICHPNPVQGGTMHNKVVTMVERALRESGLDTVRFNFRGVGESTGTFDDGRGESDDLEAVVEWVHRVRPHDELWLAGFSFGSYIALKNAVRLRADALISIAPPVGRWEFEEIAIPTCPWLIVQGEEDEVVDPQAVFDWVDSLEVEPTLVRMPETSHFFHRRLMDLRGAVKHATIDWLPAARHA